MHTVLVLSNFPLVQIAADVAMVQYARTLCYLHGAAEAIGWPNSHIDSFICRLITSGRQETWSAMQQRRNHASEFSTVLPEWRKECQRPYSIRTIKPSYATVVAFLQVYNFFCVAVHLPSS